MTRAASFVLESEDGDGIVYIWPAGQSFPLAREADGKYHHETRLSPGPWASIIALRGLALEVEHEEPRYAGDQSPRTVAFRCHGVRSMEAPREDGYDLRGRVRVGGRRARAFTSSILLRLEGKLESVPILYACKGGAR